ncbi:hypothetical protein L1987_59977 [Smallanthus sonchifolius]|uniref:Uncharacterized protein n=1 Tax=Smallanthus sonchifolius TaxID=185202 RepID=A0ACB9D6U4_9ASTR|nr:hypothetical protein L1987_59977 [Smallanthus sonchifolius]
MDLGWMGPNYSSSTACATSNFCILNAANHIIRGEADMMLCGGSDAVIIPIGVGGFVACRALSERNSDPSKASRPWDSGRDGFVMGEGAGVLLLEELEHAKKRGAKIYAEFLGGSFTCDAYHMTEPHPQGTGVILCIEKALSQAGVAREDVNYINAHATSTPAGDLKEYRALLHCFVASQLYKIHDCSPSRSSWCCRSCCNYTGNTDREAYQCMLPQQKEKGKLRSGKAETLVAQKLQEAQDEYNEVARLRVFRVISLMEGLMPILLTQATRHHTAHQLQMSNFTQKGCERRVICGVKDVVELWSGFAGDNIVKVLGGQSIGTLFHRDAHTFVPSGELNAHEMTVATRESSTLLQLLLDCFTLIKVV